MLLPPLTLRIWPVMNRESSRARNASASGREGQYPPNPASYGPGGQDGPRDERGGPDRLTNW